MPGLAFDLEVVAQAENIVPIARAAVANAQMMRLGGSMRSRELPRWMRLAGRWAVADFWRRDVTRYCRDLIKCGREGAGEARDRVAWRRDSIFGATKRFRADPSSPHMLAHPPEVLAPARETGHLARIWTRLNPMSSRTHPLGMRWHLGSTRWGQRNLGLSLGG